MTEDTILYRLDSIDKKLVDLQQLMTQTALQEQRLQNLEISFKEIEKKKDKNTDRWLSPLVSAVISGIVAFIFIKIGLK